MTSGYQGPGSKTVLPAWASAKVDFRLIPDQHPDDILKKLRAHLDAHGFSDIQITDLGGDPPARTDPDDPFIQIVAKTAKDVFGVPMQLVPMTGGSARVIRSCMTSVCRLPLADLVIPIAALTRRMKISALICI